MGIPCQETLLICKELGKKQSFCGDCLRCLGTLTTLQILLKEGDRKRKLENRDQRKKTRKKTREEIEKMKREGWQPTGRRQRWCQSLDRV